MTRRDFLEETLRELTSPLLSGLRFLSGPKVAQAILLDREWKKVAHLPSLNPGDRIEIKEHQLEILCDERGIRVFRSHCNKKVNLRVEIRKSNELWAKLNEEWSPEAFLCHLTLQKKED
jgi:hypothetical protein